MKIWRKSAEKVVDIAEVVMDINEDFEILKKTDEQFCLEFARINNEDDLKDFIKKYGGIHTITNEGFRHKTDEQTIMRLVKIIESVLVCKAYWSGSSGYSIKIFYNLLYLLLFKDFYLLDLEQSQFGIDGFSQLFKKEYGKSGYYDVEGKWVKTQNHETDFKAFEQAILNYTSEDIKVIPEDDCEKQCWKFMDQSSLITLNGEKRELYNPASNIIKDELRILSRNYIKVKHDNGDMHDIYIALGDIVEKACEDFENKLKRNDLLNSLTTNKINNKNYTDLTRSIFNDLKRLCKAVIDELMNNLIYYDRIRYVAKDGELNICCQSTMTKLMIDVYQNTDALGICSKSNCNNVIPFSGNKKANKGKKYCSDSCSAQNRKNKK